MTTDLQARIKSRMTLEDCGFDTPCWISDRSTMPNGYNSLRSESFAGASVSPMSRVRSFLQEVGEWMTYLGDAYVEGEVERYRRANPPPSGGASTGPR